MRRTATSAAVIAILALAACGEQQPQQQGGAMPPPMVGVAAPLKRELPALRELTGQVEAIETVELRPRVGGLIERVLAKDGAEVKAGDVILEIDRVPLDLAVHASEANLARAQALELQAKQQLSRAQDLLPQHITTQQQVDDLNAQLKAAEAQRAAAEVALASAKLDVGYARVTAPIGGRIGKIQATAGNLVQGGGPVPATLLATIVRLDPIDIAVDLDEPTWRAVAQRVRASESGGAPVPVSAAVAGDQGFPRQGAIAYADNHIDPKSGSIRVHARFANADRGLVPGAFARVRVEVAPPRPVLLINEQALQSQLAMRYVTVVQDDGKTQPRPVQLGEPVEGGLRVVAGGLGPDEKIVVSGLTKVFYPTAPVTPIPTSMEHPEEMQMPGAPGAGGPPPAGGKPSEAKPGDAAKPADAKPADAAKPGDAAKEAPKQAAPSAPAKPAADAKPAGDAAKPKAPAAAEHP
jgi:RND family efflux transporter MFP subunit